MNINERLSQIVELKGYTARSFSAQLGVSSQRFSNYLKDRDPDYDTLNRIIETFVDIDPRWLLTGEGEMIKDKCLPLTVTNGEQQRVFQLEAHLEDKNKIICMLEKQVEMLEDQIKKIGKDQNLDHRLSVLEKSNDSAVSSVPIRSSATAGENKK